MLGLKKPYPKIALYSGTIISRNIHDLLTLKLILMAKYSRKAGEEVKEAMHEMKQGKLVSGRSGKKVTSRAQAVAIGLSEAREKGAKVPKKAASKSSATGGAKTAKSTKSTSSRTKGTASKSRTGSKAAAGRTSKSTAGTKRASSAASRSRSKASTSRSSGSRKSTASSRSRSKSK